MATLAAAALAGAILPTRARVIVAGTLTALGSASAFWVAADVLWTGVDLRVSIPNLIAFSGATFELDALGAVFCAVVALVAVPAAIYGIGYSHHSSVSRSFHSVFPMFVLAMLLVPAAGSVTTFLLCWELMALTSLLLVMTEHRLRDAVRNAAAWYAVMTHVGLACILVALVALASHSGGESFAIIRATAGTLSPAMRATCLLLVLAGFGSKAGVVPLHVWLPRAHPEAPSHVSALLSGAMVKLGIYGILRVGFDLVGSPPRWWGHAVLWLGIVSALFGVLHAIVSSDLKRLLAYSTSENVGLVMIGIGAAAVLSSSGRTLLAGVVLTAAILHVVNHAAFKGLLFMGAGSVLSATGTRDLDRLGGLVRRMPATAVLFAIGCGAITALPPLNGFVSEWLLLQGLVGGGRSRVTDVAIAMPIAVVAVALTAGLVAATFVKAFGTGFLAQPRSPEATAAREIGPTMVGGMSLLAVACVTLGVAAPALRTPLANVATTLGFTRAVPLRWPSSTLGGGIGSVVSPLLLGLAIVAIVAVLAGIRRLIGGTPRRAETWGCGRASQTARMEYTATSFAEPVQRVFDDVLRPTLNLEVSHKAESEWFVSSVRFHGEIRDSIERHLYVPLISAIKRWGVAARVVQSGSVHRYLAYAFVAVLVVLVIAR